MNEHSKPASVDIGDVVASWLICLAIALVGFLSLGDGTRAPNQDLAVFEAASDPEIFSDGANKVSSPPVSMAVRHC